MIVRSTYHVRLKNGFLIWELDKLISLCTDKAMYLLVFWDNKLF